ncbi:MAG: hypothetical protein A2X49_08600 [Lentisphaerae bacterium GWF2_52_8]|nr:MAG: hypothetical protein A2X49_08600 [Lentisphaerae bacterium GWF2_52_8]
MHKGDGKNQDLFRRQSYFRLLRYAAPYKGRLIIGIISGFIVGGSLLGSMLMIPQLMRGVDGNVSSAAAVENRNKAGEVLRALENGQFNGEEEKLEAAAKILAAGHNVNKIEKEVERAREKCKNWGIELPLQIGGLSLLDFNYRDGNFALVLLNCRIGLPAEDKDGKMTWQFFSIFVIGFVILWALKNIATYANRYYTRWVGTKVVADLRDEVFNKLMNQSLVFYGKVDVGQLISRCTNDTAAIETAVANTIADATRCPIEIGACVAAIIIACISNENYALPAMLLIGLPLCVVPIVVIGRRIRRVYQRSFAKIADVVSRMHEVFTGILVVKAYHMEEKETSVFKGVNRKYFRTVISALKAELMMQPLMEVVAVSATLVFMVYSYSQKVTLTELAQILVPAFLAYQPIKNLAKVSTYIQRSMAAADRYFDLIDTDTSVKEHPNPVKLTDFKNEVSFNNVVFGYEPNKKILDDVSFKIPKGSVVAVVGETGSGKTTIANLIARFYDVTEGSVSIDGHDVRDLEVASLRDHIGIVSQDAILFNDTIASNIAYGCPDAPQEEIEQASKMANAHMFIVDGRHPEGYATVVGEKGFKLSGGEKQRVSIARAILKNPPILILDEATSALDTVTERLVQEALNRVMENRTVFAIAHRLSTIKHANLIIVLDKGKIVERGTHDELMSISDGRYRKLHDTQFGIHS